MNLEGDAIERRPTLDDWELARREAERRRAEDAVAAREAATRALEGAIAAFEVRYFTAFAPIYAELDALDARIAEAAARAKPDDRSKRRRAERARGRGELAAPEPVAPAPPPEDELRLAYRALSKLIHPDLATDEAERAAREALMARANAAYAARDAGAIAAMLDARAPAPPAADPWEGTMARIAAAERALAAAEAGHAALERSALARLMRRVEKGEQDGRDVFAKLRQELEAERAAAQKRLRQLERRAAKHRQER